MKKNTKLLVSVLVVVLVLVGIQLIFEPTIWITGATSAEKRAETECITADAKDYFDACSEWSANGFGEKPSALSILSDSSAQEFCARLLEKYKTC